MVYAADLLMESACILEFFPDMLRHTAVFGCRSDGAKFFYDHVKVGTPVAVGDY